MTKVHCDQCGAVIPDTVRRLTLRAGLWCGATGDDLVEPWDLCPACVARTPFLTGLVAAVFGQQLDAGVVYTAGVKAE